MMKPVHVLLAAPALALALYAPAASAEGGPVADEVLTTDGGIFRGTIVEHAPGGDIVLLLPSGEIRRFPATGVRYAGPLQPAAPLPPQPSPGAPPGESEFAVRGPRIAVRFEAPEPTTLYAEGDWAMGYRISTRGYVRICTAPCTFAMPAGAQRFALGLGDDKPRPVDGAVTLTEPSTMRAAIESRQALRTAGIVILTAGTAAGVGMFVAGYEMECHDPSCTPNSASKTLVVSGLIVGLASVIGGVVMLTRHDVVGVEISPLAPVQSGGPSASLLRGIEGPRPADTGAAITVRF